MASAIRLFGEVFSSRETFGHATSVEMGIEYFAAAFGSREAVIETADKTGDIEFGRVNWNGEFEAFDEGTNEARKVYYGIGDNDRFF